MLRRIPPAARYDLPVGTALAACWLLVAWPGAHLGAGLLLLALVGLHLRTRWTRVQRLFSRRPFSRRRRPAARAVGVLLVVLAVAMTVSGVLRWAGVPAQYAGHAISSYLVITVLPAHLWLVRRPLRARMAPPGRGRGVG